MPPLSSGKALEVKSKEGVKVKELSSLYNLIVFLELELSVIVITVGFSSLSADKVKVFPLNG